MEGPPLEARYQSGADQTSAAEKRYQATKYAEIIEILLSAGYFRARISGLSEFDKVVGGLCWCLTSSGADIDVDILFQENSTIGQRIKLSETIVMVLRKIRCRHPLQAHQIQGSDFPALHPVITWLVHKFHSYREATAAQLRKFAELRFEKEYDGEGLLEEENGTGGVISVAERFRPRRNYRRHLKAGALSSEEARVQSCLLEYGESVAHSLVDHGDDGAVGPELGEEELSLFERKLRQAQREAEQEEEEIRKRQEEMRRMLMQELAAERDGPRVVSGSAVGTIIGLQSSQIFEALAGYDEMLEEARRSLGEGRGGVFGQMATFTRQKESLKRQLQEQQAQLGIARMSLERSRARVGEIEQELGKSRAYSAYIVGETSELTQLEQQSGKSSELVQLRELVLLNDSLKAQESQFKESCKLQLGLLEDELRAVHQGAPDEEELTRVAQIDALHAKTTAKHAKMRQLLAARNLCIASTSRLIDDVPTRTELIQYERRFAECYEQVALKLEETRKYYDFYNTLDSTREILRKQIKLLTSISESFDTALRNRGSRDEFLRQFEAINKGVVILYQSKLSMLEQQTLKLHALKAQYQASLDEQRRYFRAVKDFQDECTKNDMLSAKLGEVV